MSVPELHPPPLGPAGHLAAGPIRPAPPPPSPTVPEVAVDLGNGAHVWTRDTGGAGAAVLLLHSGIGNLRFWEYQLPVLVAAGYRAVAFDRRGHGRTMVEPDAPAAAAADDLRLLADRLQIDRFHLVGTAQGGRIANDFALSWPDRLLSLAVVSSSAGVRSPMFSVDRTRRLLPGGFAELPADFRELGPAYRMVDPEGVDRWAAAERANEPSAAQAGLRAQPPLNDISAERLRMLDVPTLLVTGDADPFSPPPAYRELAGSYRRHRLVIVPECGHSPYWERPDLFNAVMLGFLRDPDGSTGSS